ncbi:phosphate ABC transporter permease PstA [Parasphaerochaeta coccoides]|uniref:Phosphate transport system permease protein PstA n=1 Tax=Parasphaerochaeta coccoides (strain ATCC BAA-1237 / DSM 17374 / SPN1) TaxID=760011 RepID=F4GIF7_PARC1|nr:phosphate ABC transporter permease PstA [Parasphaerochaeta coccoides]AEC01665.1 phosphate ABC transporter, inner membrane subunit PstA [Parasphaerochaeta coccoides DSM 17374]
MTDTQQMLAHDKRRKSINRFAIGSIKILSSLTVLILVVIIGYLAVRGLYKQERTQVSVLPLATAQRLGLSQTEIPFDIVANKRAEFRQVDWNMLREMAQGKIISLRRVTYVNENFFLYVDESIADEFARFLDLASDCLASGGIIVGSFRATVDGAAAHNGSIAIVPRNTASSSLPSALKTIAYEEHVLVVHPTVTQLYGNNMVGVLSDVQVDLLLSGEYSSWVQLHGGDIPVALVQEKTDSSVAREVAGIEGSVGVTTQKDVFRAGEQGFVTAVLQVNRIIRSPNLTFRYLVLPTQESGRFGGIGSIIINTFLMVFLTTLIAAPLGIAAAVYLVEYAKKGRLTSIIRSGIDVLASIPSIIFGLFGLLVFVQLLGWSFSLISGTLTVALMILPTIIRTSEEAIRSVEQRLREASIGMGATKMETIWRVVLPSALNGITTGIILAMGRAIGETAALLYTIGSSTAVATGLSSGSRVLALHIMLTINEGQSFDKAFASAFVLIVVVLIINTTARWMMNRASVKNKGKE